MRLVSKMNSSSASSLDGAREREFYKYYGPYQRIMGNTTDPSESQQHPSSDRALTALAQLGALRLNCRRTVISFFDRKQQYILAEATRSFCLHSNISQDPDDSLWLGACILSRPATICEHTFRSTAMEEELDSIMEISELGELQGHANTPPNLRFYAGAPIKSPDGYIIGTYSVFDDSGRSCLTEQETFLMKDMAKTVMLHMDLVRGHEEHVRDGRMVLGLGNFIEGKAGLEDWFDGYVEEDDGGMETRDSDVVDECPDRSKDPGLHTDQGASNVAQTSNLDQNPPNKRSPPTAGLSSGCRWQSLCASQATNNLQSQILSNDVKSTFSRAANIILTAIDVDGTAFFDASVGSFAGLVGNAADVHGSNPDVPQTSSSEHQELTDLQNNDTEKGVESKRCPVLSHVTSNPQFRNADQGTTKQPYLAEKFLHELLKRHPRGKVFNFDPEEQSPYPASKETSDMVEDFGQQLHPPEKAVENRRERESRRFRRQDELRTLRNLFPDVRSLIFIPLWDSHRQRWFAAGFAWTKSATRLLHVDSELSFLAAFGHSIMAEVARLDTAMADKAKADLLSSISHELRSPLHGILGSIECLVDTSLDTFQLSLVEATDTCGRTLLDTVDHLLAFTKINSYAHSTQNRRPAPRRRSSTDTPSASTTMDLNADVDLSTITEEAVETVFAGHDFRRSLSGETFNIYHRSLTTEDTSKVFHWSRNGLNGKEGITVILDIVKAPDFEWLLRAEAGAWRRVVMNLFGNSLKYTTQGFVHVKLEALALPNVKQKSSQIKLTVSDSGKGISKDYLNTRLFTPFAQEDPLLAGTGLGLSIVKQIVSEMGGDIIVESQPDKGTKVCVSVVMHHAPLVISTSTPSEISLALERCKRMKATFLYGEKDLHPLLSLPSAEASEIAMETRQLFLDTIKQVLKNWFGVNLHVTSKTDSIDDSDLVVVMEHELGRFPVTNRGEGSTDQALATPTLVLCESITSARLFLTTIATRQCQNRAHFLSQPFGPRKLARALLACFQHDASEETICAPASASGEPTTATSGSCVEDLEPNTTYSHQRPASSQMFDTTSQDTDSSKTLSLEKTATTPNTVQDGKNNLQEVSSPVVTRQALHFLIVDDNKINLQLLVRYIQGQNYSFITAMDGLEALEAYEKAASRGKEPIFANNVSSVPSGQKSSVTGMPAFDFVLMDISMPIMDGLEATRRIRVFELANGLPNTTIIALTGLATASAQQEAFSSGVNLFLTKPVKLKELGRLLKDWKGGEPKQ